MKKILLILLLIFSSCFAKIQKPSPIPPASLYYLDFEPGICDSQCLKKLIDEKKDFSFLSRYSKEYSNSYLESYYMSLASGIAKLVVTKDMDLSQQKIAVLLPQNIIGGYAHIVSNAVFSYIISKDLNVKVKFYLTGNENEASLVTAIDKIKNDGISLVIAPLTAKGAEIIAKNSDINMLFFIPTLHYKMVKASKGNIFFGGIDYEDQVLKLLEHSDYKNIVVFEDNSFLAKFLDEYISLSGANIEKKVLVDGAQTSLLGRVDESLKDVDVFLNLPLNATAKIIYELKINNLVPNSFFTTQINYAPKLLSLIDFKDRQNLFIANSITHVPQNIASISSILGVDIYYTWIAYSTAIGLDYLYNAFENTDDERVFKERIVGSSIDYDTKIYKTTNHKFELIKDEEVDLNSEFDF
ncbi:hypothetical protein [Campylobacter ureolyticus]|uniref:hypothetical protein n=1 Tax=Campylobacter ureolyticus TaxID=827 RepID=UPI0026F239D0|nr:hypothetical protein [Campylobacter ureolyticus]